MRVTIDAAVCNGHGQCTFAAPEVFVMGDDGRPKHPQHVPEGSEGGVEDAAALCPMQAITITDD